VHDKAPTVALDSVIRDAATTVVQLERYQFGYKLVEPELTFANLPMRIG